MRGEDLTVKKGLMIVVSGPAGSGKGTVNGRLLESDEYVYSVSATTRAPRPGEINGVNYHFITKEDFRERIARGEMLEYTTYCDNYYGTPPMDAP
jgi:guanylate kinase